MHSAEPPAGRLISWRVLGFGGRPNPLVFGRITSMIMRFAQAILTCAGDVAADGADQLDPADFIDTTVRSRLYVDDTAIAMAGGADDVHEAFDLSCCS